MHCFQYGFAPLPDPWKLATREVNIYIQYDAINDAVDVDAKGDSDEQGGIKCANRRTGFIDSEGSHR